MNKPILSIIIVNYNVKDFLNQALDSIQKAAANIEIEVFVVDNASRDGSVEMVKDNFPNVKLIENKINIGFAGANNQAISLACGKYILFMNPDTIVQEDTFYTLIQFLNEHENAGMAGCKILNPDGSLQLACRRSVPTPWVAFTKLIGLAALFPKSKLLGKYNLTYLNPDEMTTVDAVSGSFMIVKREVLDKVGLFDDQFFMYGEDLDLCYRTKQAGWNIYYVPSTKIIHYKGASTEKARLDTILIFYKAMLQFSGKHFRGKYLFFPQWFLIFGIGIRAGISFIHSLMNRFKWVAVDVVVLNISLALALLLRFGSLVHWKSYSLVTIIYSIVWLISFYLFDLYSQRKFSFSRAIYSVFLGLIINSTITYFAKDFAFSRLVVLLAGGLNLLLIPGWRFGLKKFAQFSKLSFLNELRKRYFRKEAILVGDSNSTSNLLKKIKQQFDANTDVVAAILTDKHQNTKNGFAGLPILNDVDNLPWYIDDYRANEVIFSSESIPYEKMLALMSESQKSGIEFKIASKKMEVIIGSNSIDYLGDISLVDIDYRLAHVPYRSIKRIMDVIIAFFIFLFTFPIWLFMFLRGFRMKKVPLYSKWIKFEKRKNIDYSQNVFLFLKGEQKSNSKLEKLPLLINLFKGDITLVGSEILYHRDVQKSVDSQIRLQPGLVSIFQTSNWKNKTEKEKRQYEIYYLKNYSPLLDIEILLKAIAKR